MKIKLCRIFNLFHKKTIIFSLIVLCGSLITGFVYSDFENMFIVPIISVIYCFNYSKYLKIEKNAITYRDFKVINKHKHGMSSKYIYFEVTKKAGNIDFCQNCVEKLFNVGHIQFIEEGELKKYSIYGIRKFDKNKDEIERFFYAKKVRA